MANTLLAAFREPRQADAALDELEDNGYTPEQISVISKNNKYEDEGYNTETGKDVAAGAGTGAATGGVIGGLAGLLTGVGVTPALAGLFIGGPIATALGLAGAAAFTATGAMTGVVAGGLIGALTSLGVSKKSAKEYDKTVNDGGVVIGLPAHEADNGARQILERNGATDIQEADLKEQDKMDTTKTTDNREV